MMKRRVAGIMISVVVLSAMLVFAERWPFVFIGVFVSVFALSLIIRRIRVHKLSEKEAIYLADARAKLHDQ
jgi:hypothetical protein